MDSFRPGSKFYRRLLLPALFAALPLQAAPHLRCEVGYGGRTRIVEASPQADPYDIQAQDIDGRFRFKAVVVGSNGAVDYVKVYVYYQAESQPILLHEARYQPPYPVANGPYALTGLNFLYAPGLERELQYGCAMTGTQA